jgi:hypothetical protein
MDFIQLQGPQGIGSLGYLLEWLLKGYKKANEEKIYRSPNIPKPFHTYNEYSALALKRRHVYSPLR